MGTNERLRKQEASEKGSRPRKSEMNALGSLETVHPGWSFFARQSFAWFRLADKKGGRSVLDRLLADTFLDQHLHNLLALVTLQLNDCRRREGQWSAGTWA